MNLKSLFIKSKGVDPDLYDQRKLHALFVHALEIQNHIFGIQRKITSAANDKNINKSSLVNLLVQNQKILSKTQTSFKYYLLNNYDFEKIRTNAKWYAAWQKNEIALMPPMSTQIIKYFKDLIQQLINKDIRSDKHFKMYASHLNYMCDENIKQILMEAFTALSDMQKEIFVDQLLKQTEFVQDKILSTQSMNDLISIRTECSRLKLSKLRYKIKEYQAKLVMNIQDSTDYHKESIEILAMHYLRERNDVLATITGSYANNLDSLIIIQRDKRVYELIVEDKNGGNAIPYILSTLDIMEFASAYLIDKQKLALKEALFPAVSNPKAKNDYIYKNIVRHG